jgi:hypothetical protein
MSEKMRSELDDLIGVTEAEFQSERLAYLKQFAGPPPHPFAGDIRRLSADEQFDALPEDFRALMKRAGITKRRLRAMAREAIQQEHGGGPMKTVADHFTRLCESHKAIAAFHKRKHDSLDDDHEDKGFYRTAHEHHAELATIYKDLATDVGDMRGPREKAMGRSFLDEVVPDGVRTAIPADVPEGLRLIHRAGRAAGLEKGKLSPENEEMFSGL